MSKGKKNTQRNLNVTLDEVKAIEIPVTIEVPITLEMKIDTPATETPATENEKAMNEAKKAFEDCKAKIETLTNAKEKIKKIRERNNLEVKVLNLEEKVRKEKENGSKIKGSRYTRIDSISDAIKALDYSFNVDLKTLTETAQTLFNEKTGKENGSSKGDGRYYGDVVSILFDLGFASEKDGIITITKIEKNENVPA